MTRTLTAVQDHIEELQASVARVCTEFAEMKEQQAELTHRLQVKLQAWLEMAGVEYASPSYGRLIRFPHAFLEHLYLR